MNLFYWENIMKATFLRLWKYLSYGSSNVRKTGDIL